MTCTKQVTIEITSTVEWWTFNGASPFIGEVLGTVASVNFPVGVTSVPGKVSNAAQFDLNVGGGIYIQSANVPFANPTPGGSCQFWVRLLPDGSDNLLFGVQLMFTDAVGTRNYVDFHYDQLGSIAVSCDAWGGLDPDTDWIQTVDITGEFTYAQWNLFHLVLDSVAGTFKIYINGALAHTVAAGIIYPCTGMNFLSGDGGISGGIGNAAIDELAVWAQALTAAQVAYLWNGGLGRTWPVTLP